MSIEIGVIPTRKAPPSWLQIKKSIDEAPALYGLFPNLTLRRAGSKEQVDQFGPLEIPGYFYIETEARCTLSLVIEGLHFLDESHGYLDGYGQNLTGNQKDALFDRWVKAGYLITIDSLGGRPKGELESALVIAALIARLVAGYVCIMDHLKEFRVPVGVYSPDELEKLKTG